MQSNNLRVARSSRTIPITNDDLCFSNSFHAHRCHNCTSSSLFSDDNANATSALSLAPLLSSSKSISSINLSIVTSSSESSHASTATNNKSIMLAPQLSKCNDGTTSLTPMTTSYQLITKKNLIKMRVALNS